MSNSKYLKFDWDTIVKYEKWIIDLSQLKEQILEKVYSPKGWDVVIGKTSTQVTLTLLDEQVVYYTLYGTFNEVDHCLTINKINYIFMPCYVKYEVVRLVFVASSSAQSIVKEGLLEQAVQLPVDFQLVMKQYTSFVNSRFQKQLQSLQVKEITRNRNVKRYVMQLENMQFNFMENSYDSYALYIVDSKAPLSPQVLAEQAMEIGCLESWDQDKKQLVVTYEEEQYLPTKKELKQRQILLVNKHLLAQLQKLQGTVKPIVIHSSKNKIDYRFDVKQSAKDVLEVYKVNPTWSSSTQFFYYENETVKQNVMQALLQRLLERKRPVTVIGNPQLQAFLKGKGQVENPLNVEKLQRNIQSLSEIQQQLERNEQTAQTISKKIEELTVELNQLQLDVSAFDDERKAYYDKIHDEKEQLNNVWKKKEIIESQLSELESTKNFLTISSEELKQQLRLKIDEEKQLKNSTEQLYLQLNEFKKSEKHYEEVFKLSSQQFERKLSLNQLEKRLKQYKQLNQTVEQSLQTVTQFVSSSADVQLQNLEKILTIDLTLKITTQVDEMRAMQAQLNEQLAKVDENTTYFDYLQYQYDLIFQKLIAANINAPTDWIQPVQIEKNDLAIFSEQLHQLLDNPPKRVISSFFRNPQKDWQEQLSNPFKQFVAGYKYWKNIAFSMIAQKTEIQKQVQLYRYGLAVKNGLHDRKHETINQFIRNTEIEISKIYLEMFKLNRQREELKANLKYFDESLDEQSYKNKKSDLQLQLTQFISTIRELTQTIEGIRGEATDYSEKLKQLEVEMQQQANEINALNNIFEQAQRKYDRIYSKYKNIQDQTNKKLDALETKTKQLEQLQEEQKRLEDMEQQQTDLDHLPILKRLYDKREDIPQSVSWLNFTTPEAVTAVVGITVIENVQQLSPVALKQIAQQADYFIGFVPIQTDRLVAPMFKTLEIKKPLPVLLENQQFYDDCTVALLQQFYSTDFEVKKQPHDVSTQHIRNNHYITWIQQDSEEPMKVFEPLLAELHENRKTLLEYKEVESKLRVKLFSDSKSTQGQIHKNLKSYAPRYHKLKFLKQHDEYADIHIVHFSETADNLHENVNHLKVLLLTKKPVVIISSAAYLKQRGLQPINHLLSKFQRIKESGREKQWKTSIKRKE